MTTLTPTSQDNGHDGEEAGSRKSRRDQNHGRTVSGDRLTTVMLAADVRYGNYSRGDLAAQGSLQSVSIGSSSRASTFSNDAPFNGGWSTTQTYNTAVGPTARAWGMQNTAFGGNASAGRDGIGAVLHQEATAVGNSASAEHNKATALGAKAVVQLENGVALGAEAYLSEREATPLSSGEIDARPGDIIKVRFNTTNASKGGLSVGNYYQLRQIRNAADATELSDAVTLRQVLDIVRQMNMAIDGGGGPGKTADQFTPPEQSNP